MSSKKKRIVKKQDLNPNIMKGLYKVADIKTPIRQYRIARGLSQTELCSKLDISRPTYILIEQAKKPIKQKLALEVATVLNCKVANLFSTNSDKKFIAKKF